MSARERKERFFRAANEGRQAFLNGILVNHAPTKSLCGEWDTLGTWDTPRP